MSFIVLAFNGGDVLGDCVASVLAQDGPGTDCVVVDNGSSDGSLERLATRFPAVRIVRNGRNLGFGGGMNAGIAQTAGDLVVVLNQDAVLAPRFAEAVRRVFAEDPRVGAVGGTVLRLTDAGPTDAFDAGGYFLRGRIAINPVGRIAPGQMDVFGVPGCCPAFRRAMLEDVRLAAGEYFDSRYFLLFEDIDLFFRAQLRGWRVVCLSDVVAWHRRSWSSAGRRRFFQKPLWQQRLQFRNRWSTLIKNCPAGLAPRLVPTFLVAELLLWPFLLLRRPAALGQVVLAWGDVLVALPRLWRMRRAIQARRTAGAGALRALVRGL